MPQLQAVLEDVIAWADEQFPDTNNAKRLVHLQEELDELLAPGADVHEYADVLMLCANHAAHNNIPMDMVLEAVGPQWWLVQTMQEARDGLAEHPEMRAWWLILVCALARMARANGVDLATVTAEKLAICKQRNWGPADANGIVRHDKSPRIVGEDAPC